MRFRTCPIAAWPLVWTAAVATHAFAASSGSTPPAAADRAPYTGPTMITTFTMDGNELGSGDQNAVDHLWGYTPGAPGKRLSIFLRKNQNDAINVGRDVPVTWDGKFDLALDPPQAAVTYGGNTILRFMVCEYAAGTPGANPLDPTTLDCGPYGPNDHSSSWDLELGSLGIDQFNGGHDRRTVGRLTAPGGLWFAQAWLFDGPDEGGPGTDDVSWSYQNWGLTPPGGYFTSYEVAAHCNGSATGTAWCDPSPFLHVNEAVEGYEFSAVYAGFFASAANRTLIAMRAQTRDELALLPALFDALFDDPIQIHVATGCLASGPGAPVPGALALGATLFGPLAVRRRRTRA